MQESGFGKYFYEMKLSNFDGLCNKQIEYKYSLVNQKTQEKIWERDPNRIIKFKGPELYNKKSNQSKYIINGVLKKDNVNFREEFHMTRIGKTNIYIGACPKTQDDFK